MSNIIKLLNRLRITLFAPMPKERINKPIKDRIRKFRYVLFGNIPFFGRKSAIGETSKAHDRRKREDFFSLYCTGKGLDVGYGGDPLVENVTGWDFEHGDAQLLLGVNDSEYNFVYSSHLLEHLPNVEKAIKNWWRVLKVDGYLILYLPHRDLYEKKKLLPSQFNDDHMHFFLPDTDDLPDTIGVTQLIKKTLSNFKIIYCTICDENYISNGPMKQSDGEYSIELVVKKLI